MTIKELRTALERLPAAYDAHQLVVWMPGSKIDLSSFAMALGKAAKEGEVWVEGNLRPGSALER